MNLLLAVRLSILNTQGAIFHINYFRFSLAYSCSAKSAADQSSEPEQPMRKLQYTVYSTIPTSYVKLLDKIKTNKDGRVNDWKSSIVDPELFIPDPYLTSEKLRIWLKI